MLAKWIDIDNGKWRLVVNYDVTPSDLRYVMGQIDSIGVSEKDREEINSLFDEPNHGFSVSDPNERMSLVCIGWVTSRWQWFNTIVHEIDHVQRDICEYYNVELGTEEAAYLQGCLAAEMLVL